jgi:hypothetical protein
MWEAVAAPGRVDELVTWALHHAPADARVYRSGDGRVVVIDPTAREFTSPPEDLVARAPHTWDFDEVER